VRYHGVSKRTFEYLDHYAFGGWPTGCASVRPLYLHPDLVGWRGRALKTELVIDALDMALWNPREVVPVPVELEVAVPA
jgi:hypothetical protein